MNQRGEEQTKGKDNKLLISSFVLGTLVTTARPRLSGNLRKNLA